MTIYIKKWGNSSAVRIPADVMAAAKMSLDDPVTIREEDGKIILEPEVKRPRYTLKELVDGITDENIHEETNWGPPVGREFW
jgi:antitoxin MazE